MSHQRRKGSKKVHHTFVLSESDAATTTAKAAKRKEITACVRKHECSCFGFSYPFSKTGVPLLVVGSSFLFSCDSSFLYFVMLFVEASLSYPSPFSSSALHSFAFHHPDFYLPIFTTVATSLPVTRTHKDTHQSNISTSFCYPRTECLLSSSSSQLSAAARPIPPPPPPPPPPPRVEEEGTPVVASSPPFLCFLIIFLVIPPPPPPPPSSSPSLPPPLLLMGAPHLTARSTTSSSPPTSIPCSRKASSLYRFKLKEGGREGRGRNVRG